MTKVIVTGGAGFIGSHLVDALFEQGFEVRVVDNLVSGRKENLNPKAEFHQVDICDFEKLTPIFKGAGAIFHLAALARVQPSIEDPQGTNEVNVTGTLKVLLAARNAGVKRIIFSSSSSLYGNQDSLPYHEKMEPRPLSPYALQKLVGEEYCKLFSKIYNLETVSLRYFNVYGERMPSTGAYALAIGKFLEQRKRGEPMTIVSDGRQSRDCTHVRDVVAANLAAMKSDKVGKGEVINIGSGRNFSVLQMAELIGGPTVFIEPRVEPKHTLAHITRAGELLDWSPQVKFEEGIAELKILYKIS